MLSSSEPTNAPGNTNAAAAARPVRPRRITSRPEKDRWMEIAYAAHPWGRHYKDIGHCRLAKCTKRILEASDEDTENLPKSHLADAIAASTAYKPKDKQERLLVDYTNAIVSRKIDPNDLNQFGRSAVACAAYHGYTIVLRILLDAGCSATTGHPHALYAATENSQHECMELLLDERKQEMVPILREEQRRKLYQNFSNTLDTAFCSRDVAAVQLLRDKGEARLPDVYRHRKSFFDVLEALHPHCNVLAWSKPLHWSFPTGDRRMINWIWYLIQPSSQFPQDVWINILGFLGRGWWSDASRQHRSKKSMACISQWNVIRQENDG
jgi:hypothetical protein